MSRDVQDERYRVFDETEYEGTIGYARAVITGPWVHIAGTTGLDYTTLELPEGIVEQTRQCFRNVEDVLRRSDATWKDVISVRYILPNRDDFKACWPVFREYFADVRPTATMFVAELADPNVLFEMEVVACKQGVDRSDPVDR